MWQQGIKKEWKTKVREEKRGKQKRDSLAREVPLNKRFSNIRKHQQGDVTSLLKDGIVLKRFGYCLLYEFDQIRQIESTSYKNNFANFTSHLHSKKTFAFGRWQMYPSHESSPKYKFQGQRSKFTWEEQLSNLEETWAKHP